VTSGRRLGVAPGRCAGCARPRTGGRAARGGGGSVPWVAKNSPPGRAETDPVGVGLAVPRWIGCSGLPGSWQSATPELSYIPVIRVCSRNAGHPAAAVHRRTPRAWTARSALGTPSPGDAGRRTTQRVRGSHPLTATNAPAPGGEIPHARIGVRASRSGVVVPKLSTSLHRRPSRLGDTRTDDHLRLPHIDAGAAFDPLVELLHLGLLVLGSCAPPWTVRASPAGSLSRSAN
jgi:hypothetical protein